MNDLLPPTATAPSGLYIKESDFGDFAESKHNSILKI
jgi:hypothetical protein